MANIHTSIDTLIGHTPLLALPLPGCRARLLAKLEGMNPAGSVKDRAALSMINEAEKQGLLPPGGTVIEPTSGNTGIGLAAVAASRGYKAIIVMPDTMSPERRLLMEAYGAQVVLTPGKLGMSGAVEKAQQLAAQIPGSFLPLQFENPANSLAHFQTTGPEIWADTDGQVDIFVAGVGTGGTLSGAGSFLKSKNSAVRIVAVEPEASPLLSKGTAGPHGLQGIGANFVPQVLDRRIIDAIMTVSQEQAYAAARLLGRSCGILAGISSGAALHAAWELAKQAENAGKTVVVVLPDTGERYLSTDLFKTN